MSWLVLIHRWAGLVLGVWLVAVAVSGGLLLFKEPYLRARYPSLGRALTQEDRERYPDALRAIEARFGHERPTLIKFPQPGINAFLVWLADGSQALVAPGTGETIARWRWHESLPAFLFELHVHLLAGSTGERVNGYLGLGLLALLLSGPVLWYRRRAGFPLRRWFPNPLSAPNALRSHASAGVLTLAAVLLFSASGVAMIFYEPAARVLSALFDSDPPIVPRAEVPLRDVPVRPWKDILSTVEATLTSGQLVYYYPARGEDAVLVFRKRLPTEWHPNGRSYVLVDPYTGNVLQSVAASEQGPGTRAAHAIYPLHAAQVGRTVLAGVAVVAALSLVWLVVSGWLSFWK